MPRSVAKGPIILLISLLPALVQSQDKVQLFYSTELDTCAYNGVSIPATNNTENGGLCAWVSATKRVYACPATNPMCWTWYQTCGDGSSASSEQILCDNAGSTWCCPNTETCTTNANHINICISSFDNPNADVQPGPAEELEFSALGISSVASTIARGAHIATASQSFFSTIRSSSSASSTTSTSSIFTSTSGAPISSKSGKSAAATATSSPTSDLSRTSSSLSGGAIAGVAIGASAVVAVLAASWFFFRRKRVGRTPAEQHQNQHGELAANSDYPEEVPGDSPPYFRSQSGAKYPYPQQPMVEADSGMRAEMP